MSTTDSRNEVDVIFRAYADKPVKLTAVNTYGSLIEVFGTDKERRIRVSQTDVFKYDPDLFDRLDAAYRSGNAHELRELWDGAPRASTARLSVKAS